MLERFAVTNYRGFADRVEWDLSRHGNYSFNTFAIRDGIVKNGIIYGPNGVGKSNFALAIFDVVNHLGQKWKKQDYYNNFANTGAADKPVAFEYGFRFDGREVGYHYSKNKTGVLLDERVSVDGKDVFTRSGGTLTLDEGMFPVSASRKAGFASNANNVSVVNFLLASFPLPADNPLVRMQRFVDSMLWFRSLDSREFIGLDTNSVNIEKHIIHENLLDDFSAFLHDVSGQRFVFVHAAPTDSRIMCRIGNGTAWLWDVMSTGTRSLTLLYYWLSRMGAASFVFIDEFDAFYHFKLAYAVCKRLFSLGCQVFTSSHNTYLMTNDLLRPDCNFLLDGKSVRPLSECTDKELRFGHNIEKMFRGNAFSHHDTVRV